MDQDLDKIPSPEIFQTLTKEEQEAVSALDSIKSFKRGDILINEGEYFKESYFVVKGCVRQFRIIEGMDITSEFYTEKESIFTPSASSKSLISSFGLECVEDSEISVVSFENEVEMYERFPRFEKMCRIATEENLSSYKDKFALYIASSPEERYLQLIKTRADLLNRVPQYHLATYLGVKPESLSRIRKRVSEKK